jgi:antitoxin VapB
VPLNIRDETVNQLAERLAARQQLTKTGAVKQAWQNELRHIDATLPLRERLHPQQYRVLARLATGQEADKAFCDSLNEDM